MNVFWYAVAYLHFYDFIKSSESLRWNYVDREIAKWSRKERRKARSLRFKIGCLLSSWIKCVWGVYVYVRRQSSQQLNLAWEFQLTSIKRCVMTYSWSISVGNFWFNILNFGIRHTQVQIPTLSLPGYVTLSMLFKHSVSVSSSTKLK